MVAFAVDYGFTTDLAATSVSAGFAASAITAMGTATPSWQSAGEMRVIPRATFDDANNRGVTFTIGPTDPGQPWTPTAMTVRAKRLHAATDQGFKVRTQYGTHYTFSGLTSSFVTHTIDLSSIGEITGDLVVSWEMWAGTTSTYLTFDDLHIEGTYTPAGAADIDLEPTGIASAEAFGDTVVVVVQPVDLSPTGIASGEAFGTPTVTAIAPIPDIDIGPSGIASAEAFGTPTVTFGVAGVVAYPSGTDVAAFMGTEDPQVVAVAEIHVGVITQFALVYTRGNGFYVDGLAEPIAAVVLAATARLVGNPEQLDIQIGSVRRASFFKGWSLAEQRVLNNYRGVAQ